nr:ribonuclease H-like domain-containing protein [Tanacetum cinerariifolium]
MTDDEVPTNMALMDFSDFECSPDAPLVKELVLDDKLEKKTVFPTVSKIKFIRPKQQEKPVRKPVNPQLELQKKGVINSGYSRNMTENMSYLSEYEEIESGYVAFGGDSRGGKITSKGKISTVLLRVPRKNNMYSVDLKNVAPSGGLTCLFAKATLDEHNLWHMRLGHINFKTMNKLMRGNLVRGLPSKIFKNNDTYVACQKGKQHKASCKTK